MTFERTINEGREENVIRLRGITGGAAGMELHYMLVSCDGEEPVALDATAVLALRDACSAWYEQCIGTVATAPPPKATAP